MHVQIFSSSYIDLNTNGPCIPMLILKIWLKQLEEYLEGISKPWLKIIFVIFLWRIKLLSDYDNNFPVISYWQGPLAYVTLNIVVIYKPLWNIIIVHHKYCLAITLRNKRKYNFIMMRMSACYFINFLKVCDNIFKK